MHNLTEFLSRNVHWFLFIILEIISGVLLFRFNSYQASVWFTSANYVAGIVYEQEAKLLSFFSLRENNELLTKRNLELEQQLKALSNQLYDQTKDSTYLKRGQFRLLNKYHLIQAKVVANSLDRPENLMTIDRGSADGVKKDMGVACGLGVVGIVYLTSDHYSVVIPVLSSKSNISCAIRGRGYFGYLHWYGNRPDEAYLDDVPRHARFRIGDVIVTSGYSSVFPPDMLVGKVMRVYNSENGMSYRLRVKLTTNFGNLRDVCVINDDAMVERMKLLEAAQDSLKPKGN